MVIAIFYTKSIIWLNLFIAMGIFIFLIILNRLKVSSLTYYLISGVAMWYFMLNSGVHATVTGVLLAFAIPFGNGDKKSTSYILQHFLHKPVAFFVLPLFALANTAIVINTNFGEIIAQKFSLGISLGLVIGKPIGIVLLSFLAVTFRICKLPDDLNWKSMIGVGFLGGIGFTMSIFITLLAFDDIGLQNDSKITILVASVIAALVGFVLLHFALRRVNAYSSNR